MRKPQEQHPHPLGMGGTQKLYRFPNGYGASVVQFPFSYGGDEGKWELGVIRWLDGEEKRFALDYGTPITEDVVGYLEEAEVDSLLDQIEALPAPMEQA